MSADLSGLVPTLLSGLMPLLTTVAVFLLGLSIFRDI